MSTVDLTEQDFEQAITGEGIVLVDFWAEWCGPCKAFAPIYESASEDHEDVVFAKVDTEAQPGLSAAADIQAIPTLMVFRDGIGLFKQAGALPRPALEEILQQVRALDMDDVRAKIATQQQAAESAGA
ncbi:thioredoxin [Homoserinibacter sp. YIM 151385]|uniref:thioredoxin n=1 Tax=Homoserinibacter sp. YIM 151385 TaxID=2985506 RepID=UPI0022F03300|nr:thioredoxin [Homoserinibacter sp. YIM 151385]WBU38404.1 thioredoxin [Homoserinibacter sp. YIM 151385]